MSILVNAVYEGSTLVTEQPAPPRSSKHKAARLFTVLYSSLPGFGGTPQEALRDLSDHSDDEYEGGGSIGYDGP